MIPCRGAINCARGVGRSHESRTRDTGLRDGIRCGRNILRPYKHREISNIPDGRETNGIPHGRKPTAYRTAGTNGNPDGGKSTAYRTAGNQRIPDGGNQRKP